MFDKREEGEFELTPELAAIEGQLAKLAPAPLQIDRDRLMFAAGQASSGACAVEPERHRRAMYDHAGRPLYLAGRFWAGRRFWPAAAVTMAAASLLLATMLVWQNRSQSAAQQTLKPEAAVAAVDGPRDTDVRQAAGFARRGMWPTLPSANSGYLGIRYIALTRGVGALPPDYELAGSDRDLPNKKQRSKPATARGLLDELLRAPARSI